MAKKFKITEEQYNRIIESGITLNADVNATNGNVQQAVQNTVQNAKRNGIDMNKANIQIAGSDAMNDSRIITKKELYENRMKLLKKTSKLYTVKDFLKH